MTPKRRDRWREVIRVNATVSYVEGTREPLSSWHEVRLTLYGWQLRMAVLLGEVVCYSAPEHLHDEDGRSWFITAPSMLKGRGGRPSSGTGPGA